MAVSTTYGPTYLAGRAQIEMLEAGFKADFDLPVRQEVQSLIQARNKIKKSGQDLRALLWSSIDNPDSQDLDQLEYAEELANGDFKLLIAIAEVDSFVPKDSLVDKHAGNNTTSVYTGVVTFPMLPPEFSYDLTSLTENSDRQAIVVELSIDKTGVVHESDVFIAQVRNHAKLNYPTIGAWLMNKTATPESVLSVKGLEAQIQLQSRIKDLLKERRRQEGSLVLKTIEAAPVMENGEIVDLAVVEKNPARDLIEEFMISANTAVTQFLEAASIPCIKRVVRTPDRWSRIVEIAEALGEKLPGEPCAKALAEFLIVQRQRDPLRFPDLSLAIVKLLGRGEYIVQFPGRETQGHFALAIEDYTHATAPNRRYPDLLTQRMLKAVLNKKPQPYSEEELEFLSTHCTNMEAAAKKVERTLRKVAAAVLLSTRIGEVFDAIVTGKKAGSTYVRLIKPPAEGKIVQGEHGLDVGDKVKVRLLETDPDQAHIDFARVKGRRR